MITSVTNIRLYGKQQRLSIKTIPSLFLILSIIVLSLINNNNDNKYYNKCIAYASDENEETCEVMQDGSCVPKSHDNDFTSNKPEQISIDHSDTVNNLIPPLPAADNDGYVETQYGVKQQIVSIDEETPLVKEQLYKMHNYMHNIVYVKEPSSLKENCLNRNERCTLWAATGECEANPPYMTVQCAPACLSCDKLLYENRCPLPANMTDGDIWVENDLNKMFDNIATNNYYKEQYGKIDVILHPGMKSYNTSSTEDDSPWVIVIDDFLSVNECETLIELGANRGYEVSKEVGERLFDGTYASIQIDTRTSTNAWCLDGCHNHTITQQVFNKMVNLTNIPDANAEYMQILKYEVGQFYGTHHDYKEYHVDRLYGARIITVFLYLNDVEQGGGTNFPILNATVMPKRGRVLIWPSVKSIDPNIKDPRTDHQALPVEKGIKYAANTWYHLRDFKLPYKTRCI